MGHFAVHDSTGIRFSDGAPNFGSNSSKFEGFEGSVKSLVFSVDGRRCAWIANGQVCVVEGPEWVSIGKLQHSKAQEICFSPKGSYLAIWEYYTKNKGDAAATPNLSVYDVSGKKLLKAFFQQSQTDWQPQWTADETIMARNVTNEVHFYKSDDLQTIIEKKILPKVKSFSLSPSSGTHYVTFYVPSVKAAPAFVHLYQYPNFKDASCALANKSFFKVDSVETHWNKQNSAALLLTAAEMDKSGTSYYGEQMLFYLNTKGDSTRITFSKQGNIHSVAWCPNGHEFFAVYGTMPSKATLFNHKCDPVAEFDSGARNTVLVNPVGNVALLGGFGNISGRLEMWDIGNRKMINDTECPDATSLAWSPCGQYLLTSTNSPRLRVNNGHKVWHYTGALQYDQSVQEQYAAMWIPDPEAAKPFAVKMKPVQAIESDIKSASKQRYIPPSQRAAMAAGQAVPNHTNKKFLSQHDQPETASEPQLSKAAIKNKKKKEAKKKRSDDDWRDGKDPEAFDKPPVEVVKAAGADVQMTGDPEKDKKIKNIKKKLDAIAKLKLEQTTGKVLEKNQLDKVATENKLIEELEALSI